MRKATNSLRALLSSALVAACGHGNAQPDPTWTGALNRLATAATAPFSFRFTGPAPEGAYVHIAVYEASVAARACAQSAGSGTIADTWYLDLEFGNTVAGTYDVTTLDAIAPKSNRVNVALVHRQNGETVANYPATAGTVTLAGDAPIAPSPTDLGVTIDASFPIDAVQQLGCQGGQSRDGALDRTTCSCRSASGETFTCTPTSGFDYCCSDGGASQPFTIHVTATSCPSMCRVAAGLPDYCTLVTP
jgi:hypothetical protein